MAPPAFEYISDVTQVADLVAALEGRPPGEALSPGELAGSLTGGVSANKPLAEAAAKLRDFANRHVPLSDPGYAALIANWGRFFVASETNFMGDEMLSCIYSSIHLLSVTEVARWSSENGDALPGAAWWCAQWWHLADLFATPAGYVALIGERSGGHPTNGRDRAILSYLYAVARGAGVQQAVGWCKAAGAGLTPHTDPKTGAQTGSWEYPAAQVLGPTLAATYAARGAHPLTAKMEQPLRGARSVNGSFYWYLAQLQNMNTPGVAAVSYSPSDGDGPDAPRYLPDKGGPHFRQQSYHSTCQRRGNVLVFTSDKQGNGSLTVDSGLVALEVAIGDGGAAATTTQGPAPAPQPQPQPPSSGKVGDQLPPVLPPASANSAAWLTGADLGPLADSIAALRLPHQQLALQSRIVGQLRGTQALDQAGAAAIADQVATFGIGAGQPQAAPWRAAIALLRGGAHHPLPVEPAPSHPVKPPAPPQPPAPPAPPAGGHPMEPTPPAAPPPPVAPAAPASAAPPPAGWPVAAAPPAPQNPLGALGGLFKLPSGPAVPGGKGDIQPLIKAVLTFLGVELPPELQVLVDTLVPELTTGKQPSVPELALLALTLLQLTNKQAAK